MSLGFVAYGLRVGVRVSGAASRAEISDRLPPERAEESLPEVDRLYSLILPPASKGAPMRRFSLVYSDAARLARTLDREEALSGFESDLRLWIAERARRRLFVHAGVVSHRGHAIVLPGRSHWGKTTLVAALLRAGAEFLSDEFAVLDERGRVHPYAAPLQVRRGGRQARISVGELGRPVALGPLPVGAVLVTRYREGARFRPRRLSAGQGVLALLSHTVAARRRPKTALSILKRVAEMADVVKTPRGEAEEIVDSVLHLLDDV